MPSLFRFLAVIAIIGGVAAGVLYVLATRYEPVQQEETKVVPGVKIRKQ
jgi:type II secretory pathway pseudopilin PulG